MNTGRVVLLLGLLLAACSNTPVTPTEIGSSFSTGAPSPSGTAPTSAAEAQPTTIPDKTATPSSSLVFEAANPFRGEFDTGDRRVSLEEEVWFEVTGDPRWVNETVYFQTAIPGTQPLDWRDYDSSALNEAGQAETLEASELPRTTAYRARLPASATHPELVSRAIVVEWAPSSCLPTTADPPAPLVASDGTTYAFSQGVDANGHAQWSIVASKVRGMAGATWRQSLDACWGPRWPWASGSDGTAYIAAGYRERDGLDADRLRLVALGPDGIVAVRDIPTGLRSLVAGPDGTVYSVTDEIDPADPMTVRGSSLAALDPRGEPMAGWPFTSVSPISDPAFEPDGTLYLGQSMPGKDRIVALGSDGRAKPGWPYIVPGELASKTTEANLIDVPRAPSIAPDASLYDAFNSGIYMVRPNGRVKAGWPYVMPPGMSLPSPPNDESPILSPFEPVLTADGRMYLPRRDRRQATTHDDLICLLENGTLCPGWPVKLPNGTTVDQFYVDGQDMVQLSVGRDGGYTYTWLSIRPNGTIID